MTALEKGGDEKPVDDEILEYEDDLLAALEIARTETSHGYHNEPESITRPEAEKLLKISREKTKKLLSHLVKTGKLRRKKIERINAWGDPTSVPGYKLVRR